MTDHEIVKKSERTTRIILPSLFLLKSFFRALSIFMAILFVNALFLSGCCCEQDRYNECVFDLRSDLSWHEVRMWSGVEAWTRDGRAITIREFELYKSDKCPLKERHMQKVLEVKE